MGKNLLEMLALPLKIAEAEANKMMAMLRHKPALVGMTMSMTTHAATTAWPNLGDANANDSIGGKATTMSLWLVTTAYEPNIVKGSGWRQLRCIIHFLKMQL